MYPQEPCLLTRIRAEGGDDVRGNKIVCKDCPVHQSRRSFQPIHLPWHGFPGDAEIRIPLADGCQSKRLVVRISEHHQHRQMIGRYHIIVRLQRRRRRRIRQQIGPEHLAADEVRKQQAARHDVIITFIEPICRLDRMRQIAAADRIYRSGELQTRRCVDQSLDAVRMARRRSIDILVHVTTQHVRMKTGIRGQKDRDEKVRDRAGLSRAFGGAVRILRRFQMDHEHMQRLREIRHRDLRLKQIPREIRIRISPLIQIGTMQIALRRDDRKPARDTAANKAVCRRIVGQIITRQKRRNEIRHLIRELVRNFVQRDDVRIQILQFAGNRLHLQRVRAPIRRAIPFHIVSDIRKGRNLLPDCVHGQCRRQAVRRTTIISDSHKVSPSLVGCDAKQTQSGISRSRHDCSIESPLISQRRIAGSFDRKGYIFACIDDLTLRLTGDGWKRTEWIHRQIGNIAVRRTERIGNQHAVRPSVVRRHGDQRHRRTGRAIQIRTVEHPLVAQRLCSSRRHSKSHVRALNSALALRFDRDDRRRIWNHVAEARSNAKIIQKQRSHAISARQRFAQSKRSDGQCRSRICRRNARIAFIDWVQPERARCVAWRITCNQHIVCVEAQIRIDDGEVRVRYVTHSNSEEAGRNTIRSRKNLVAEATCRRILEMRKVSSCAGRQRGEINCEPRIEQNVRRRRIRLTGKLSADVFRIRLREEHAARGDLHLPRRAAVRNPNASAVRDNRSVRVIKRIGKNCRRFGEWRVSEDQHRQSGKNQFSHITSKAKLSRTARATWAFSHRTCQNKSDLHGGRQPSGFDENRDFDCNSAGRSSV